MTDIDALIHTAMEQQHLPGLSLAVVKNGTVLHQQGYGLANLELHVPATPETVYQIGSITKPFTAIAIMALVHEGKLRLDEPICTYFDHAPMTWHDVTVQHLLAHTSGIIRDGISGYWATPLAVHQNYTHEQMLELVASLPLDFAPGTKHSYSNSGYFLLGLIIERVTGGQFEAFLAERVFTPLGMTVTRVNDLRTIIQYRASGYVWTEAGWANPDYIGLHHHFANGGLVSSVVDLMRWDAALYTSELLPMAVLEQMWSPITLQDGTPVEYGLGWNVTNFQGHRLISHGGAIPGFTTYIARFVDAALSIIVLTNLYLANPRATANSIAEQYLSR